MKIEKRFYCAGESVMFPQQTNWRYATVDEAVAHAKDLLDSNPRRKEVYITQVILVVRPAKSPIEVLEVE